MPQSTTLTYLLSDHPSTGLRTSLGSTSLAVDAAGTLLTETRYKPWGEVRYTDANKTLPTRYTYTGQYSYIADDATDIGAAGFGLMFYNARWYDPSLGRFAQADSIVPRGIQGFDRYAYVANNPIRYTDPTGHMFDQGCVNDGCGDVNAGGYIIMAGRTKSQSTKAIYEARAIEEVIQEFDIRVPITKESRDDPYTLHIVLGGPNPQGDPTLTASTDCQEDTGVCVVTIWDEAFGLGSASKSQGTAGNLAVTLDHEFCHVNQFIGQSCLSEPKTNGRRADKDLWTEKLNEIEARIVILENQDKYAYGGDGYGVTDEKIDGYNEDIDYWLKWYPTLSKCVDDLYFILSYCD